LRDEPPGRTSPEQPRSSRERGAVVADRYLIERELGRGAMSTVFLARDLKHNREVALKFVHGEFADPLGIERFQREIATIAKLQHPHILPLYDSGETAGSLHFVMPYVGGGSLRDRLERETQIPLPDALRIAREVADALAFRASARRGAPRHQAGERPLQLRPCAGGRLWHRGCRERRHLAPR
jgi:serine/threonine protein kinase